MKQTVEQTSIFFSENNFSPQCSQSNFFLESCLNQNLLKSGLGREKYESWQNLHTFLNFGTIMLPGVWKIIYWFESVQFYQFFYILSVSQNYSQLKDHYFTFYIFIEGFRYFLRRKHFSDKITTYYEILYQGKKPVYLWVSFYRMTSWILSRT